MRQDHRLPRSSLSGTYWTEDQPRVHRSLPRTHRCSSNRRQKCLWDQPGAHLREGSCPRRPRPGNQEAPSPCRPRRGMPRGAPEHRKSIQEEEQAGSRRCQMERIRKCAGWLLRRRNPGNWDRPSPWARSTLSPASNRSSRSGGGRRGPGQRALLGSGSRRPRSRERQSYPRRSGSRSG